MPPEEIPDKATDFLTVEMKARLKQGPVQFALKMDIADPGDDVDDPTTAWPVTRLRIRMGTIHLDQTAEERHIDVERLSYNPMRLPTGIEPSGDAILHARGEIYQLGCKERNGMGCPLLKGREAAR